MFTPQPVIEKFNKQLSSGEAYWNRLSDVWMTPDGQTLGSLWNENPNWKDAISGPNGDPFFMAAVSSVV